MKTCDREIKGENAMENITRPTLANGKICYIEIPADDINRSSAFYRDVFGWQIRERSDGEIAFDDTGGEVSASSWPPAYWHNLCTNMRHGDHSRAFDAADGRNPKT